VLVPRLAAVPTRGGRESGTDLGWSVSVVLGHGSRRHELGPILVRTHLAESPAYADGYWRATNGRRPYETGSDRQTSPPGYSDPRVSSSTRTPPTTSAIRL
jgi:hypothetical protein